MPRRTELENSFKVFQVAEEEDEDDGEDEAIGFGVSDYDEGN